MSMMHDQIGVLGVLGLVISRALVNEQAHTPLRDVCTQLAMCSSPLKRKIPMRGGPKGFVRRKLSDLEWRLATILVAYVDEVCEQRIDLKAASSRHREELGDMAKKVRERDEMIDSLNVEIAALDATVNELEDRLSQLDPEPADPLDECQAEKFKNAPYLLRLGKTTPIYNPHYGDERMCKCGHPYYRHFDTYDNMRAVGCKYCDCTEFKEALPDGREEPVGDASG